MSVHLAVWFAFMIDGLSIYFLALILQASGYTSERDIRGLYISGIDYCCFFMPVNPVCIELIMKLFIKRACLPNALSCLLFGRHLHHLCGFLQEYKRAGLETYLGDASYVLWMLISIILLLRPRVLVDVSNVDLSTTILGFKISAPIMIAPTAMHKLAHPEGELATARAAAAAGTIMVLSFSSTSTVEEVAATCDAVRFFQLYVYKNRSISAVLVQRAERAGYKAIVLTADTPKLGRREADIRNRLVVPSLKNLEGLLSINMDTEEGSGLASYASQTLDSSFSWKDIKWLQSLTSLPILIKGILTAEDAELAIQAGFAGIIVSNHGARQLDFVSSTIVALEEVTKAVRGRVPVLFDGGIRRGTDVFKALAIGAQAVLVGRPIIYGLAVKGESGVKKVLEMLQDELELAMSLSGCCRVEDITRSYVQTENEIIRSML